jgi:hypothetical protein
MFISYSTVTDEQMIQDGRVTGYFEGVIENMGDQTITNSSYTHQGELDLKNDGKDFTYQMSENLINQAFEAILGKNQVF